MSLKDLTLAKHKEAESTAFMLAVFAKTLPISLWIDWTYQKWLFYKTIECSASSLGILKDLPDIQRTLYLFDDYTEMNTTKTKHHFRSATIDYNSYLLSICKDADKILAHLYTWHMGDMFGGQMIKKIVPGSHKNLEFQNPQHLIITMRSKLNDSLSDEANLAFDWAIRMMRQYDSYLE